jgi:hypothetical protein
MKKEEVGATEDSDREMILDDSDLLPGGRGPAHFVEFRKAEWERSVLASSKEQVHSIFRSMKKIVGCAVIFSFALATSANSAPTAKIGSLTGLLLYPATRNVVDRGDPSKLPKVTICRCKMEMDFYSVYDAKVDATLAWCVAHLRGSSERTVMAMAARRMSFIIPMALSCFDDWQSR